MHMVFWWGDLKGDHLGDPGIDGRLSIRWIFRKWGEGRHGLDRAGSAQGQVAGCFECGNEPLGSIKHGEFLN